MFFHIAKLFFFSHHFKERSVIYFCQAFPLGVGLLQLLHKLSVQGAVDGVLWPSCSRLVAV